MSNTFPDDCEQCKENKAKYIAMIESENWLRSETKKLCANCIDLDEYRYNLIESWTFQEWLECGS